MSRAGGEGLQDLQECYCERFHSALFPVVFLKCLFSGTCALYSYLDLNLLKQAELVHSQFVVVVVLNNNVLTKHLPMANYLLACQVFL